MHQQQQHINTAKPKLKFTYTVILNQKRKDRFYAEGKGQDVPVHAMRT
jgi:hypothetical protein